MPNLSLSSVVKLHKIVKQYACAKLEPAELRTFKFLQLLFRTQS